MKYIRSKTLRVKRVKMTPNRKPLKLTPIRRSTSLILMVIGLISTIPFCFELMFADHSPYMSMFMFLSVCAFVVGLPMFICGVAGLFTTTKAINGVDNQSAIDISRIRHAIETKNIGKGYNE